MPNCLLIIQDDLKYSSILTNLCETLTEKINKNTSQIEYVLLTVVAALMVWACVCQELWGEILSLLDMLT